MCPDSRTVQANRLRMATRDGAPRLFPVQHARHVSAPLPLPEARAHQVVSDHLSKLLESLVQIPGHSTDTRTLPRRSLIAKSQHLWHLGGSLWVLNSWHRSCLSTARPGAVAPGNPSNRGTVRISSRPLVWWPRQGKRSFREQQGVERHDPREQRSESLYGSRWSWHFSRMTLWQRPAWRL